MFPAIAANSSFQNGATSMSKRVLALGLAVVGGLAATAAVADVAIGVRATTFGFGGDIDIGMFSNRAALRLGYNGLSYSKTVTDTDVSYDGKLKISAASAIVDWFVFNGGFRVSLGAVQHGPKVDVVGTPTNGTYKINGQTYTAAQLGSLTGTVKMGSSIAPYIGIGWGNAVDKNDRVTFLFDLGVIHTGSPKATLNAPCSAAIAAQPNGCAILQQNVNAEKADLENEVSSYQWYPVVGLGVAVRF
jgi:hypothetical protein